MKRALTITCACAAALGAHAAAQERATNGYMKFFGGVHEPIANGSTVALPGGFDADYLAAADEAARLEGEAARAYADTAFAGSVQGLRDGLRSRDIEGDRGFLVGASIGTFLTQTFAVEAEVAYREHEVDGALPAGELYDATLPAFTEARAAFLDDRTDPAFAAADDADRETTIAATTYMINGVYHAPVRGRLSPYAALGLGYASPAGTIEDYEGDFAYQVRAGAELDLGAVLLGVQATYVGAADFERELDGQPAAVAGVPFRGGEEGGKAGVEYEGADVAVTLTVPFRR